MKFLVWQFTIGWRWYWKRVWFNLKKLFHFFSFLVLLKTLFAPWKRLTAKDDVVGFDIAKFFENLSFDLISRIIGAIVRVGLIFFCLIMGLIYILVSAIFFGAWLVIPFLGWSYYERDQKRSQKVLKDLVNKIKNDPKNVGKILFESEIGEFIRNRLEKNADKLLMSIELKTEDLINFDSNSLEEIMLWFLSKSKEIGGQLQRLEITNEDLILAAKWWDRRQVLWRLNEEDKWSLGRPGIGWNLFFGYTPNLDKCSENLSLKQNFASHLIGRDSIVKKMGRIINSGKNILLVGEPGVGKKTVVYAFADMAITGKLGGKLAYKKMVLMDYQSAISISNDKDYKKKILNDLMREAETAGNIVLVLKDISKISNTNVEGNDYLNVFTSILDRGKLNMVAISGRVEYERFLATDQRILKNFEIVEIIPPNKNEAMMILLQAIDQVEMKTKKRFSVQAVKQILEGSDRYITDIPFPEKLLEFMDQVVVAESTIKDWITVDDVNKVLSEKTGISIGRLSEGEKKKLTRLEEIISESLIGQKTAVDLISKSLRSRIAVIKNNDKPIGSFLFLGPTGVGKTQTAKVLADVYYGSRDEILRFDMAEYTGNEGLERLIGSIKANQPGLMTSQIRNKPASLLLLDEIEKAPPEIYNLFLTILDEGYFNDAEGNKVNCQNLFIVATSNAGAEFIRNSVNNGAKSEELQKSVVEHIQKERIFSPEFLNRFDGVVVFESLNVDSLVKIARLMLKDFQNNLAKKNININFDDDLVQKIAKEGSNVEFGARPMRRIVDLILGDVLGKAILENKILPGDNIKLLPGKEKDEYLWNKLD
jgi:ATP-dependent Clp protease ATP-binding subunit ClpC